MDGVGIRFTLVLFQAKAVDPVHHLFGLGILGAGSKIMKVIAFVLQNGFGHLLHIGPKTDPQQDLVVGFQPFVLLRYRILGIPAPVIVVLVFAAQATEKLVAAGWESPGAPLVFARLVGLWWWWGHGLVFLYEAGM